jgi:hypothetical protein
MAGLTLPGGSPHSWFGTTPSNPGQGLASALQGSNILTQPGSPYYLGGDSGSSGSGD